MTKKILNVITTAQSANEQKQKTKTVIANLGTATQLTLGPGGSYYERGPKARQPQYFKI